MVALPSGKMKRKDLEDVYDDFSDFSVSSPATKIRRLDAELPSSMIPSVFYQSSRERLEGNAQQLDAEITEDVPMVLNKERSLVLYKSVNTPLLESPLLEVPLLKSPSSNLSFKVNSEFIQHFKDLISWSGHPILISEVPEEELKLETRNKSLAMVPWVPSSASITQETNDSGAVNGISAPMDVEEEGTVMMEIEEDNSVLLGDDEARNSYDTACSLIKEEGGEELQQKWQHCGTPQIPPPTSTPIMWSW